MLGFDPDEDLRRRRRRHRAHPQGASSAAQQAHAEWQKGFDAWAAANPERKALLDRVLTGELPDGVEAALPVFEAGKDVSTRAASGKVLNALGAGHPRAVGRLGRPRRVEPHHDRGRGVVRPAERSTHEWTGNPYGRVLHFGIREHAMGAILNGIVLHGNTRAFGGTFLIFSDYMRPAVRLAALMKAPSIFVWTHDSVALGEDGPTHQPIEQLATLRAIPGLDVVRPGDANEIAWAWKTILERRKGPAGIALTRQNIPVFERGDGEASGDMFASADERRQGRVRARRGAERHARRHPHRHRLRGAARRRRPRGAQGRGHQRPRRVGAEPGVVRGAGRRVPRVGAAGGRQGPRLDRGRARARPGESYVGDAGRSVSIEHFGASADYKTLFREFGITTEHAVAAAKDSLAAL